MSISQKMIDFEENGTFSPFINDDLSCYLKSVVLYPDILLTREEPFFFYLEFSLVIIVLYTVNLIAQGFMNVNSSC